MVGEGEKNFGAWKLEALIRSLGNVCLNQNLLKSSKKRKQQHCWRKKERRKKKK